MDEGAWQGMVVGWQEAAEPQCPKCFSPVKERWDSHLRRVVAFCIMSQCGWHDEG